MKKPTVDEREKTHFGFEEVPWNEKVTRVREVFHSVAPHYDLMNDLMSMGLHRIWKRITIALADIRPGKKVLDLAGGTGDLAVHMAKTTHVTMADINAKMLAVGRDKLIDQGLFQKVDLIQADAEALPFPDNEFDVVTIAFGLRNVTNKMQAIKEIFRVLKPGGRCLILEFSTLKISALRGMYDAYSFKILPKLGEWFAKDSESYRYLAESIRKHPPQEELLSMLEEVGFVQGKINNFMGGVVALHRAVKI